MSLLLVEEGTKKVYTACARSIINLNTVEFSENTKIKSIDQVLALNSSFTVYFIV